MTTKKIEFVSGDDWTGLYLDGKLVLENHSLHFSHVLKELGIEFTRREADSDWLYDVGQLPESIDDVKFSGEE